MKIPFEQIVSLDQIGKGGGKRTNELFSLAQKADVKPAVQDEKKVLLLLIDMQNDFMENGELAVPNSHVDVANTLRFIYRNFEKITDIAVSLDTHRVHQIFHPSWWTDRNGNHPEPFTVITARDVEEGKWLPAFEKEISVEYVKNLERSGKKQLVIWPYHCLEGTFGCALEGQLANMVYFHSLCRGSDVKRIVKGQKPTTEMYGIFKAEYDPTGARNDALLEELRKYDQIVVAGEAKSHCVLESLWQLVEYFAEKEEPASKIYCLEDCMSPIPGFEEATEEAYRRLSRDYGVHLVHSAEWSL